ncbi:lysozyme g-like [Cottoperca gobio]|uniref:Lysozyme g n=1 Tax=Cottoperca gobio TaxID=56716 RepID=A0A6J2PRZ9_COTGO|nr:lysozyme g-like [Cottoperca gobio]
MGNVYGDIKKVETSGASKKTAQQDNLSYKGERASHTMAKTDADRMKEYIDDINRVAKKHEIDPALISAIISRESRAGATLKDGWGDYDSGRRAYNAWGLMQVDVNPKGGGHEEVGEWDSEEHLDQATGILVHFIKRIRNKFPNWSTEQQLKGGIAAYNMGDGNVHSYDDVDENTTGGDYSNDVVARAQWYKSQEWRCSIL